MRALALPALCLSALARIALAATPALAEPASTGSTASETRRLSDAITSVAEKVGPSVVQVEISARDPSQSNVRWYRGGAAEAPVQRGMGSGVVFTADGAILTNNHVIEDALSISVRLRDGRLLAARLLGRDPATDLAVVKIDAKGLAPARFADSDAARVGEWVVAIGSPFGLGYTVTSGVLSAKARGGIGINAVEDYLQTDASINPGNSGGPLVGLDGRVLGINTMVVGRGQGIGFAVPANLARRTAEQILRTGHVQRAWIGVGIQDVTPELAAELKLEPFAGALVNAVGADTPGARAHLKAGDVVATVDGKRVRDAQDFIRELLTHEVGQIAVLEVLRAGQRYATKVELQARPDPQPPPIPAEQEAPRASSLGLSLRDVPAEGAPDLGLPARAVTVVAGVVPGSAADRAGLRAGDAIVEADGTTMPATARVAQAAEDGHMLLRVRRRDALFYAAVRR